MNDAYLSPAETARRLGVSANALRLYEQRGLVRPPRSASHWRAYGPDELARLHQILALKHLGLSLRRIAELLAAGREPALADVLAFQEEALLHERGRVDRALALVRAARAKLAKGQALSVDDLATLTTETTMTGKPSDDAMKALFEPIIARHFTPEERAALARKKHDNPEAVAAWNGLIAEAKALMSKGDRDSPELLDLARRWKAMLDRFTASNPAMAEKAKAVWRDAWADPDRAANLPLTPEVMEFMGRAVAKLKEIGE